jgi:hypothetical protein
VFQAIESEVDITKVYQTQGKWSILVTSCTIMINDVVLQGTEVFIQVFHVVWSFKQDLGLNQSYAILDIRYSTFRSNIFTVKGKLKGRVQTSIQISYHCTDSAIASNAIYLLYTFAYLNDSFIESKLFLHTLFLFIIHMF